MTEEPAKSRKKSGRDIGGISQYATFGSPNDQTSENADTLTAERPAVQTSRPSTVQSARLPDVQTSSIPNTQTSRLPDVETVSTPNFKKSKHPEWKQQTVYLPPALAKWLKVHAVQVELEISEIVAQALKEYRDKYTP